ncbi:MAG: cyclic nucleotide-binding/CBS domain-containing protein [Candidatus Thorarchaeota archaeon]
MKQISTDTLKNKLRVAHDVSTHKGTGTKMSTPTHTMAVKDIMSVNVVTMPPDASVLDVAKSMSEMDLGSIVVTEGQSPVGIITESDIVRRVVAEGKDVKKTCAKDIMTSPLVYVSPNTALTEAMRIMARSNIRRVVVLKNDSLAGIITSRDILKWSPELIDILVEALRLRNGDDEPEDLDDDELIEHGGTCDSCGEYSTDLIFEDGRYLCEACRE